VTVFHFTFDVREIVDARQRVTVIVSVRQADLSACPTEFLAALLIYSYSFDSKTFSPGNGFPAKRCVDRLKSQP
jgi:hypothetical protein